jgi:hypothetical protein
VSNLLQALQRFLHITARTTIKISHFSLRVVSAEFQTSRSETRQKSLPHKFPQLDSCPYNLPTSAIKVLHNTGRNGNKERFSKIWLQRK